MESQTSKNLQAILRRNFEERADETPAVLGDGHGNVRVPNEPNLCYARVGRQKMPLKVRNTRAPAVDGMPVTLVKNVKGLLYVRQVDFDRIPSGTEAPEVGPHASTHAADGSDPVYLASGQVTSGLVYISTGMILGVYAGWIRVGGALVRYESTTIDMTSHRPATGARYSVIQIGPDGAVTSRDGAAVGSLLDLQYSDVPAATAGHVPLAVVRTYAGQTSLARTSTSPDLLDARFAPSSGDMLAEVYDQDGDGTVDNAEAVGGVTLAGLSQVGHTHSIALNDLADVVVPTPADGDVLTWSEDTSEWVAQLGNSGSAAGISAGPSWEVDGTLEAIVSAGVPWVSPDTLTIKAVYIACEDKGTAGSTIVDVNKNGTTIFSAPTDRPTLAWNAANSWAKSADPGITAVAEGDILTFDIDSAGAGAEGLRVFVKAEGPGGVITFLGLADTPNSFTGSGGKVTRVKSTEDKLEFVEMPGVDSGLLADRPASAIENSLWLPTNGVGPAVYTGGAWLNFGLLLKRKPVVYADFTWVNQGGASVNEANGSLYLAIPAVGGDQLRILKKAAPATPYTITVQILPHLFGTNYHQAGIGWRQSSDGKLVTLGVAAQDYGTLRVLKWNSASSYNGSYTNPNIAYGVALAPLWLRIADTGVNRVCSWSLDGTNFLQIHSVGRTDFMTGNEVLMYGETNNGTWPAGATYLSWEEN